MMRVIAPELVVLVPSLPFALTLILNNKRALSLSLTLTLYGVISIIASFIVSVAIHFPSLCVRMKYYTILHDILHRSPWHFVST